MSMIEFTTLFANSAAINNILLIGFIGMFAVMFIFKSMDKKSPVSWPDLLLDNKTNRLSLAKFGQFWGIAISTWIVIFLAQHTEAYGIFPMVFPMYLAYIGGTWSYNAWLKSKQGSTDFSTSKTTTTTTDSTTTTTEPTEPSEPPADESAPEEPKK